MRVLYLIGSDRTEDRPAFRTRVLGYARDRLAPLARDAVVSLTEEAPPALSVIPFRRDRMALVSLEGVADPGDAVAWPTPPPGFAGAFAAEVAYPVVHERAWPFGQRSPGAGLLTLFRRKKGLDESEFLRRWFDGHTPLTLEVHPNVGYVRNRVLAPIEAAGPAGDAWDGIVEEQYDPPADLLRPSRFFGGSPRRMPGAMLRVYRDIRGFIDYPSIRTWLTAEYRLGPV